MPQACVAAFAAAGGLVVLCPLKPLLSFLSLPDLKVLSMPFFSGLGVLDPRLELSDRPPSDGESSFGLEFDGLMVVASLLVRPPVKLGLLPCLSPFLTGRAGGVIVPGCDGRGILA